MSTHGRLAGLPLATAVLGATVFFFAPLQIYLGNITSFSVPLGYHAAAGLGLALAAATAVSAALLLLPRGGAAAGTTAVLAAVSGLWIQGNLMVWRYGPMDGRPIDWSAHRT